MKDTQFGKDEYLDELAEIAGMKADQILAGLKEEFKLACIMAEITNQRAIDELWHQMRISDDKDKHEAFRQWAILDRTADGLRNLARGVKTPITHPKHHTVGKYYGGHSFGSERTEIYRCTAYDPDYDYRLESVTGPPDVRKVSPRAINATFWPADDRGDYWFVCQWGVRVPKTRLCERPCDQAVQRPEDWSRPAGLAADAIAVHLDTKKEKIVACEHCRGGSSNKGCGPNCIRGKTLKEAQASFKALPVRWKLQAVDY